MNTAYVELARTRDYKWRARCRECGWLRDFTPLVAANDAARLHECWDGDQ